MIPGVQGTGGEHVVQGRVSKLDLNWCSSRTRDICFVARHCRAEGTGLVWLRSIVGTVSIYQNKSYISFQLVSYWETGTAAVN